MSFGLDYVAGPSTTEMKTAGVAFVCRYTGYFSGYDDKHIDVPQGKCLTPGEAEALSKAGIALVSNWEWYDNRAVAGRAAGEWDAGEAAKIHLACGGPADRPIYFSVDVNVPGQDVIAYFQGVASVIGLHRTGAYGSYAVLHELFNAGLIAWGWQTYAWSYGAWESRAHIQQYSNNMAIGGHSVDYNHAVKSDFGQWYHGGGEQLVKIDLSNPVVAAHFAKVSETEWRAIHNGVSLKGPLLKFYQTFGNALCGLTWLGLPLSPEIPIPGSQHEATMQHFENGVLNLDVAHEFDTRPGDNGPVYLAKLYSGTGQDPRIGQLQAQLAALEQKISSAPTSTIPVVDPTLSAQINTLQGQLQAATSRLAQISPLAAQINQLSGVGT